MGNDIMSFYAFKQVPNAVVSSQEVLLDPPAVNRRLASVMVTGYRLSY